MNPGGAGNPVSGAVKPFGLDPAIEEPGHRLGRRVVALGGDDVAEDGDRSLVILGFAHEFKFRKLHRVGDLAVDDAVNLQPVSLKGGGVGNLKQPPLMAFGKEFAFARVERDPGVAAIVGTEQSPILRVALGEVVSGSEGVLADCLSRSLQVCVGLAWRFGLSFGTSEEEVAEDEQDEAKPGRASAPARTTWRVRRR